MAALVDTGSSINVISKNLYDSISDSLKLSFEQLNEPEIRLANNDTIRISGVTRINSFVNEQEEILELFILPVTSHPLILGTEYLKNHNIVLDFTDFTYNERKIQIQSNKKLVIEPNTELVTFGKLPSYVTVGVQGVCSNSKYALNHAMMVAKSLVCVPYNHKVPVKILNASNLKMTIPKGKNIAEFTALSNDYACVQLPETPDIPTVQNMQLAGTNRVVISEKPESKDMPINEKSENEVNLEEFGKQFNISDNLTENQRAELRQCLYDNRDLFVTPENPNLGFTTVVEHKINLKHNAVPKHQKPYRLPPYKREILREQLDDLLSQGIIAPVSESEDLPITSPVVLVTKRSTNGDRKESKNFRFCCDFRHLNSQTTDFKYFIPNLLELTESFAETTPNFITSVDLSSGFFQMGISPDSTKYTAFNTCFGTYKFLRLPMGLKTAPNTFQLLMDKVLHGLKFRTCLCYLDDVLICSETFEGHIRDLTEIFDRFRSAGLKLGPKKCYFAQQSCVFLGHEISKDGIKPPKNRVQAIVDFPEPKNIKQLRRLIGMYNWFRKFIPNFSSLIYPLTKLLKKNQPFEWKIEQQTAFENLKYKLINSDILHFPRFDLTFRLAVDTSSRGIGYMLYQTDSDTDKPMVVRFGSKSLTPWQQSYGPTKLELLGMVTSILDCADYLRGTKFIVECDHQALQPLFQKQFKGAIYERWLAILQQFSFEIHYKPAEQMQVADALSRSENPTNDVVESPTEDDPYFPYVTDNTGTIELPDGTNFVDLFRKNEKS